MPSGKLTTANPNSGKIKIFDGPSWISVKNLAGATVSIVSFLEGVEFPLLDEGAAIEITADDDAKYNINGGTIELQGASVTTPVIWSVTNGVKG